MNGRRSGVLLSVLVVYFVSLATPTWAAKCGSTNPKTKKKAVAALALVGDQSVVNVAYKRDTDPRTFLLIYKVAGCNMAGVRLADLRVRTLPKDGGKEIPDRVVKLIRKRSDPAELSLRLSIDHSKLHPGTYAGVVEVRAPSVSTTRTPLTVSRSETNVLVPLAIGAVAGLLSLVWYGLQKAVSEVPLVAKWPYLVAAVVVAALAGAAAVFAAYLDQDVWSWSENAWAAGLIGFTGATTGTFLVFLGNIWKEKEPTDGVARLTSRIGAVHQAVARRVKRGDGDGDGDGDGENR